MLAPYALGVLLLLALPAAVTFALSLTDYDLFATPSFAGLRNFGDLVDDPAFRAALPATIAFLALAVLGLTSQDPQTVRSAFLVMEPAAGSILVPLSFASLLTGVLQSLGGAWGLFRHYWVVFKLLINVAASIVLLLYMQTLRYVTSVAADPATDLALVRSPSPLIHAGAALLLLLVAVILSVYKPRGLTPYGARRERERRRTLSPV